MDPIPLVQLQFDHWIAPGLFANSALFLRQLDTCGLPVCIVSNIDRSDLERAVAFHRFDFPHIVTSDDVRAYKPRSEMFVAALRILGCEPDEVLHIGDSRHSDIAGALAMGVDVVWVNRTSKVADSDSEATFTVRSLDELAGILW